MILPLTFKEAMDGWNNTFVTGDPSHLSNIVTDDFVCRPTEGNETLAQVLKWATNAFKKSIPRGFSFYKGRGINNTKRSYRQH